MQRLASISTPYTLRVLSQMKPLRRIIPCLPQDMHALALQAHSPHFFSHSRVHLHHLDHATLTHALCSAAAFPHILSLSLRGQSLTPASDALHTLLQALPHLTQLSLADTCLAPSFAKLATALPRLPHLLSLDVSDNNLPAAAIRTLASTLTVLTSLHTLRLASTLKSSQGLASLTAAMQQLPLLEVAIGTARSLRATLDMSNSQCRMFEILAAIPTLHSLDVSTWFVSSNRTGFGAQIPLSNVYKSLLALTQIKHLSVDSSMMLTGLAGTATRPPGWIQKGLSCMHMLKTLDIAGDRGSGATAQDSVALLIMLAELPQLQALLLPVLRPGLCACKDLLQAITKLTKLTKLAMRGLGCAGVQSGHGLATALQTALPQLRELHVPVTMLAGDPVAGADCSALSADGPYAGAPAGGVAEHDAMAQHLTTDLTVDCPLLTASSAVKNDPRCATTQALLEAQLLHAAHVYELRIYGADDRCLAPLYEHIRKLKKVTLLEVSVDGTPELRLFGRDGMRAGWVKRLRHMCISISAETTEEPIVKQALQFLRHRVVYLVQLRRLQVAFTVDEGVVSTQAVLQGCAELASLQELHLTVHGNTDGMDVSCLSMLHGLVVQCHVQQDAKFWGSLEEMPHLRRLEVVSAMTAKQVNRLVCVLQSHLLGLQHLTLQGHRLPPAVCAELTRAAPDWVTLRV